MSDIEINSLESSLDNLVDHSDRVMVYGFFDFGTCQLGKKLENMGKELLKHDSLCHKEGSRFVSVLLAPENDMHSLQGKCKLTLTNYVVDNYFRSLRGEKIAPLIFCLDSNQNCEFSPLNLSDSEEYQQVKNLDLITVSELRRAYKLCYDPSVDLRIRKVACQTFRFIKIIFDQEEKIKGYELISPPWKDQKFISTKNISEKCQNLKNWRYHVNGVFTRYSFGKEM
jgi:hypothetical protein